MTLEKQITEDQHWAPRFYLSRFVNEEKKVEILDLELGKITKPRSTKGICKEPFFYAQQTGRLDQVGQVLEEAFQQEETQYANKLDSICTNILSTTKISDETIYVLSNLISSLWLRSKYFREQLNQFQAELMKDLMIRDLQVMPDSVGTKINKRLANKIGREDLAKLLEKDAFRIIPDNRTHLLMFAEEGKIANAFYEKNWRFYIAEGDYKFITSDTPVVEVHPVRTMAYGAGILSRTQYFTLTPSILIELSSPHRPGKKIKRKTLFSRRGEDFEAITDFNIKRVNNSYKFAYSSSKKELLELAKYKEK